MSMPKIMGTSLVHTCFLLNINIRYSSGAILLRILAEIRAKDMLKLTVTNIESK